MSLYVYDTSPNPGDEPSSSTSKKTYVRTRCTARTLAGHICRKKSEQDCRYCKVHTEMYRVTIPTYEIPSTQLYMNELRPCPSCSDNITYGGYCSPCVRARGLGMFRK